MSDSTGDKNRSEAGRREKIERRALEMDVAKDRRAEQDRRDKKN